MKRVIRTRTQSWEVPTNLSLTDELKMSKKAQTIRRNVKIMDNNPTVTVDKGSLFISSNKKQRWRHKRPSWPRFWENTMWGGICDPVTHWHSEACWDIHHCHPCLVPENTGGLITQNEHKDTYKPRQKTPEIKILNLKELTCMVTPTGEQC